MKVYFVCNKADVIVRQIAPAYSLEQLYANMAEYACGEPLPSLYAQSVVAEHMLRKEKYSIIDRDIVTDARR